MDSNKPIYANKFSVSFSDNDAHLKFTWEMPCVDDSGEITGKETLETQSVSMTKHTFIGLAQCMADLLNKEHEDNLKAARQNEKK